MPGHWEGLSRHKDTSPFTRTLSHCTQVPFMRRISGQNANSREMRFTWEETARNESITRTPLLVLNGIHIGTHAPLGWAWVKAGSGPEPKCHGRDVNGGWRALRMLLNLQLEELWYFKESNLACHLMLLSSGKRMNSVCHGYKDWRNIPIIAIDCWMVWSYGCLHFGFSLIMWGQSHFV